MSDSSRDHFANTATTARWRIRRQSLFFYEIDAEALAPLIAPALELTEVRPGIAMLTIECLHYYAGHFRAEAPECGELVVAAMVHPDLSIAMPVPRFALQVLRVLTDSPDIAENESRLIASPIQLVPDLRVEFTRDGMSASLFDGERPIITCRNIEPTPLYESKVLWGLTYTNVDGLQHGAFRWEGDVHEHMKRGNYGAFHDHPVFTGIDTRRVRGCYRQMSARPDASTDIRYYHLGAVRT